MKKPTKSCNLIKLSEDFRKREKLEDGAVVIVEGKPVGWIDQIRDPHTWQLGAIAVTKEGELWEAIGCPNEKVAIAWSKTNKVNAIYN